MYPKVKVRAESQQNQTDHHQRHAIHDQRCCWCSLLSLKDVQFLLSLKVVRFLSFQDSCFSVNEPEDVSSRPIVRIPESHLPRVAIPTVTATEDKKSNIDLEDKRRTNVGASSILRPRAVVSSPNNDAAIGKKNRNNVVRTSPLKNHTMIQSRHADSNEVRRSPADESLVAMRKLSGLPTNMSSCKGIKGRILASST